MNKFLFCMALFMVSSTASADYEPVPDNTPLLDLPRGASLLVKKDIIKHDGYTRWSLESTTRNAYRCFDFYLENHASPLKAGEVLPVTRANEFDLELMFAADTPFHYRLVFNKTHIYCNNVRVVSDFHKNIGDVFQIIYDPNYNPYSGMEKNMVVDIVMSKITDSLKKGDYKNSLWDFAYLQKLNVPLPESFDYYYTDALEKSGKTVEAKLHATDYLKKYGKKGKYYAQVVEIMSRSQ